MVLDASKINIIFPNNYMSLFKDAVIYALTYQEHVF